MSSGAVVSLLIGLAMLVGPAWVLWLIARRWRRLATWSRAEGSIRQVWKTKGSSSATGTDTSETTVHARYAFKDSSGREQLGECTYLKNPKVGDTLEIMYSPDSATENQPVYGGSVVGRVLVQGFVIVFFGGIGLFMVLVALDVVSL